MSDLTRRKAVIAGYYFAWPVALSAWNLLCSPPGGWLSHGAWPKAASAVLMLATMLAMAKAMFMLSDMRWPKVPGLGREEVLAAFPGYFCFFLGGSMFHLAHGDEIFRAMALKAILFMVLGMACGVLTLVGWDRTARADSAMREPRAMQLFEWHVD